MATSTQQKQELFKTIWATAEDLRNSVDGWDFKQYVLGMLFYRFISENITNYINRLQQEAGMDDFDYASFSDEDAESAREMIVQEKGFFILPSELFCNVRARAKNDPNLNETLQSVFDNIESSAKGTDSEDDLKGLFDDIDVNSNKLGNTVTKRNETLCKILNTIGSLDLKGDYADNQIDVFGDAYEFLMTMYAGNAGKSGGEFFTPQEVSELLARITVVGKKEVNKVYDPACGSGSLLLQFAKVLGKENVRTGFFGQEINITTYNLCRINMFLHDINYEKFDIHCGAFRCHSFQSALFHQVGGRFQSGAYQRPAFRTCRSACAENQGRPCLYYAHAVVAFHRRNSGNSRVSRCALSWRSGAENPQISDRQ